MSARMTRPMLRDQVRSRLALIAFNAELAQKMALDNDNLTDVLDNLDNDVQEVIKLVEQARGVTK